jgi:hypothetical protein
MRVQKSTQNPANTDAKMQEKKQKSIHPFQLTKRKRERRGIANSKSDFQYIQGIEKGDERSDGINKRERESGSDFRFVECFVWKPVDRNNRHLDAARTNSGVVSARSAGGH